MPRIEEFIDDLNLPFEGEVLDERRYILNVDTSDDFAKLFNHISLSGLNLVSDSTATENKTEFTYTDGTYDVRLSANYNNDDYEMYVEEI